MKVTKRHYDLFRFTADGFVLNSSETIKKTINCKIPYSTGSAVCYKGTVTFPNYLKGFEKYYEKIGYFYTLKSIYVENRPEYSINVEYEVYDITPNEGLKKELERRKNMYKNLYKKYSSYLND